MFFIHYVKGEKDLGCLRRIFLATDKGNGKSRSERVHKSVRKKYLLLLIDKQDAVVVGDQYRTLLKGLEVPT